MRQCSIRAIEQKKEEQVTMTSGYHAAVLSNRNNSEEKGEGKKKKRKIERDVTIFGIRLVCITDPFRILSSSTFSALL